MPKNPRSASLATASLGNSAFRSHSPAWGATSRWAKSRASATISPRCSSTWLSTSAVGIEPAAALPAQLAGGDHLPEQGARPVLVVSQPPVQDLQDRDAHVEADQVRKAQRPHRMIHPELHHRVD